MSFAGRRSSPLRPCCRWRNLLILFVVFSLSFSLATRVFHLSIPGNPSLHSDSAQSMRQHLDRDAMGWVAPIPYFTVLQAASFYPRVAPAGPPLPSTLLDESLANRPPPFC